MILIGEITNILTQRENDWGRYVITNPNGNLTAVGVIPAAALRMKVTLVGEEVDNKYGHSFKISDVLNTEIRKDNGVYAFLASGLIKGVGKTTAELIVNAFGEKSLDLFESEEGEKKLLTIKGFGPKKLVMAKKSYDENKQYKGIYLFLNGFGTQNQVKKIYDKYGNRAVMVLKENPYRLIHDISGYGFRTVDAIAKNAGVKADSEFRLIAAIEYAIETDTYDLGNCYYSPDDLKAAVKDFLCPIPKVNDLGDRAVKNAVLRWSPSVEERLIANGVSSDTIEILKSCVETRTILEEGLQNAMLSAVEQGLIINDDGRIYSRKMYRAETDAARRIAKMVLSNSVRYIDKSVIDDTVREIEQEKDTAHPENAPFQITKEQKSAIYTGLMHRVSVISGGPGRGKTTITEAIARAFVKAGKHDSEEDVIMLAPTGRAAQRMHESTGFKAVTAHRAILNALEGVSKDNALNLGDVDIPEKENDWSRPNGKLVICDETSMVDIYLFQKILWYAENCNLIFVGDADQLASVGPGSVLRDMIASGELPCVLLKEGHRNSGAIAQNAAMINRGLPISQYVYDEHFRYFPIEKETALDRVVNDYVLMCNKYGLSDVLLCTAMKQRGPVCVNELNKRLQEIYTKGQPEMQSGGKIFRVGDRVMNIRNNYRFDVKRTDPDKTVVVNGKPQYERIKDKGVFNGERGVVYRIATREEEGEPVRYLCVRFDDGSLAAYTTDDFSMLTLAYATTVHKCQGSEAKCVMLVFTYSDFILLRRSLFYTGETRAREEFRFYGENKEYGSVFDLAVSHTDDEKRKTRLAERIQEYVNNPNAITA